MNIIEPKTVSTEIPASETGLKRRVSWTIPGWILVLMAVIAWVWSGENLFFAVFAAAVMTMLGGPLAMLVFGLPILLFGYFLIPTLIYHDIPKVFPQYARFRIHAALLVFVVEILVALMNYQGF